MKTQRCYWCGGRGDVRPHVHVPGSKAARIGKCTAPLCGRCRRRKTCPKCGTPSFEVRRFERTARAVIKHREETEVSKRPAVLARPQRGVVPMRYRGIDEVGRHVFEIHPRAVWRAPRKARR